MAKRKLTVKCSDIPYMLADQILFMITMEDEHGDKYWMKLMPDDWVKVEESKPAPRECYLTFGDTEIEFHSNMMERYSIDGPFDLRQKKDKKCED